MSDLTTEARMTVAKIVAKPGVFSSDHETAHRAASPYAITHVRDEALKLADTILEALSALPVLSGGGFSPLQAQAPSVPTEGHDTAVVGPGGWLVKDFADGWYWTGDRLNADMAANGGASVFNIVAGQYETALPAAPEAGE